ncbi:MAG: hypothetical protein AAF266_00310 [Planctomycetota bacterium]
MSLWDGLLLAVAVLVAVRSLTGMMRKRANRLVEEVQKQVDAHREREKALKRKQRQQEARAA